MIQAGISKSQLDRLQRALGSKVKRLPREIAIAVNATAAKTKGFIAKSVSKEIVVPQKIIKKTIKVFKAKPASVSGKASAKVRQKDWNGFPLKMLKPVQNASGVNFKGKGRAADHRAGAFLGPKVGTVFTKFRGHAFKRAGKRRLPIQKQFGPAAIEIFIANGTKQKSSAFAKEELKKQIERRIRFITLKNSGAI